VAAGDVWNYKGLVIFDIIIIIIIIIIKYKTTIYKAL